MVLVKFLSIALAGVAGFLLFGKVYGEASAWWGGRIDAYATWMTEEYASMLQDMPVRRAKQLITASIVAPLVLGYLLAGWFAALVFAAAGYFGGWGLVAYTRKKRLKAIDDQLVDALVMLGNGLKAGLSLIQALELVAREMKPPIADEVARVVKEVQLGRLTDDALRSFAERVPLEDVRLVVDSILTLRETGGNLGETFQVIAHTVTERKKVQGKIQAMTAQGMTQGIVMCLFPIGMLIMFSFVSPDYIKPLFTSWAGWGMLGAVVLLDGMGLLLMFTLVKVDV
jgi:tight adherence protein B